MKTEAASGSLGVHTAVGSVACGELGHGRRIPKHPFLQPYELWHVVSVWQLHFHGFGRSERQPALVEVWSSTTETVDSCPLLTSAEWGEAERSARSLRAGDGAWSRPCFGYDGDLRRRITIAKIDTESHARAQQHRPTHMARAYNPQMQCVHVVSQGRCVLARPPSHLQQRSHTCMTWPARYCLQLRWLVKADSTNVCSHAHPPICSSGHTCA